MAYITNDGSRLIERARTEGKSIVFGSVRMNTTYKSDPTSLVQKSDEWFGENHGSVVGCISHVSVDDVSQVCDSKLAVQCNDNSVSWKSIGIYARLDGEVDELLFACESIENGEYKDVTIVELPVTLDGVVADFGLSEGGSGGGGGEVPANMMTTDTDQTGLTGIKRWEHRTYDGGASAESPNVGDSLNVSIAEIGSLEGESSPFLCSNSKRYYNGSRWLEGRESYAQLNPRGVLQLSAGSTFDGQYFVIEPSVEISPNGVNYTPRDYETVSASWDNIINAANSGGGGGEVPANMMTTDTEQVDLTGMKTWTWENYEGTGSLEEPHEGDIRALESFSIFGSKGGNLAPLVFASESYKYDSKKGSWSIPQRRDLLITSGKVDLGDSSATWADIIRLANKKIPDTRSGIGIVKDVGGNLDIFGNRIQPDSSIQHDGLLFMFDSSGYLKSVCPDTQGIVATIGVVVKDADRNMVENGRVSGFSSDAGIPLTFQSPIQLADAYTITYQAIFST